MIPGRAEWFGQDACAEPCGLESANIGRELGEGDSLDFPIIPGPQSILRDRVFQANINGPGGVLNEKPAQQRSCDDAVNLHRILSLRLLTAQSFDLLDGGQQRQCWRRGRRWIRGFPPKATAQDDIASQAAPLAKDFDGNVVRGLRCPNCFDQNLTAMIFEEQRLTRSTRPNSAPDVNQWVGDPGQIGRQQIANGQDRGLGPVSRSDFQNFELFQSGRQQQAGDSLPVRGVCGQADASRPDSAVS